MLLFIWKPTQIFSIPEQVSIHLMLLFIGFGRSNILLPKSFQYISCYSLSFWDWPLRKSLIVSIHLMLLFIRKMADKTCKTCMFQYISCYSLSCKGTLSAPLYTLVSIHLMLLFILLHLIIVLYKPCFNTSHVTLYR